MRRLLLTVCFLLCAARVQAQQIARWDFRIYNTSSNTLLSTTPIPLNQVTCNQDGPTPPPVPPVANPTDLWWDDLAVPGKKCHYISKSTDPLITMPTTSAPLAGTMTAISGTGVSGPESPRLPFTKPGTAPAVVTGFILQ